MEILILKMANNICWYCIVNDALVCIHSVGKKIRPTILPEKKGFIDGADTQSVQVTKNELQREIPISKRHIYRVIF